MALIIGGAAVRYIAKNSSWLDAHSIGEMIIKEKKRERGGGGKRLLQQERFQSFCKAKKCPLPCSRISQTEKPLLGYKLVPLH